MSFKIHKKFLCYPNIENNMETSENKKLLCWHKPLIIKKLAWIKMKELEFGLISLADIREISPNSSEFHKKMLFL